MTIEWRQYRIKSNDFGYQTERKINPSRWKAEWYHPTFAAAVQNLLEHRIRTETEDCIIQAVNQASARADTAKLVKKMAAIADEISEALDDRN